MDWYGVNIFNGPSHPKSVIVQDFITHACEFGFPVMFGESTPRQIGVLKDEESWLEWYQDYFYTLIFKTFTEANDPNHLNNCIHAFCYINWNWTNTTEWSSWGDARIQDSETVGSQYQYALDEGNFFHGMNKSATLNRLGLY